MNFKTTNERKTRIVGSRFFISGVLLLFLGLYGCKQEEEEVVAETEVESVDEAVLEELETPDPEPNPSSSAASLRIMLRLAASEHVNATHFELFVVDGVARVDGEASSATEYAVTEAIVLADPEVESVNMMSASPALVEGEQLPTNVRSPDPSDVFENAIAAGTPIDLDALPQAEVETEEEVAAAASGDRPRTYRVQSGDSLSIIARRTMNDGSLWRELFEHNRSLIGPDPERLQVGMELRIPQD